MNRYQMKNQFLKQMMLYRLPLISSTCNLNYYSLLSSLLIKTSIQIITFIIHERSNKSYTRDKNEEQKWKDGKVK